MEQMENELQQTEDQNQDLYELKKKKAKLQGVMVKADNLTETQERTLTAKANRKIEKKIKELFLQLEDEQEKVETE